MSEATIRVEHGVAIVTQGDTVIALWKGASTIENWRVFREELNKAIEPTGSAIAMSIILPSSGSPDSRLREVIKQDMSALGDQLRRWVFTVAGEGIYANLVRTLVRGTMLLARRSSVQVFADTVREGTVIMRMHRARATPPPSVLEANVSAVFGAFDLDRTQYP